MFQKQANDTINDLLSQALNAKAYSAMKQERGRLIDGRNLEMEKIREAMNGMSNRTSFMAGAPVVGAGAAAGEGGVRGLAAILSRLGKSTSKLGKGRGALIGAGLTSAGILGRDLVRGKKPQLPAGVKDKWVDPANVKPPEPVSWWKRLTQRSPKEESQWLVSGTHPLREQKVKAPAPTKKASYAQSRMVRLFNALSAMKGSE